MCYAPLSDAVITSARSEFKVMAGIVVVPAKDTHSILEIYSEENNKWR